MPKISVVTSVYNCERFVGETIQSVIGQTFTDWEYIIIDDCSKDRSAKIIQSFADKDKRIKLHKNEINKGQCESLNWGIRQAEGKYIARLDHDDLCHPERFEKQLDFMERNADVVLCGCHMNEWKDGKVRNISRHYARYQIFTPEEIRFSLLFGSFVVPHSSFFLRKSVMIENNIRYRKYKYAEDFDMQIQLLKFGNIASIPEPLVTYRVFPENFTNTYPEKFKRSEVNEIQENYIESLELGGKEFLAKGLSHSLESKSDLEGFEKAFSEYAVSCGIKNPEVNEKTRGCLSALFFYALYNQNQAFSLSLLSRFIRNPYGGIKPLISLQGGSFVKRCLLHSNKKFRR